MSTVLGITPICTGLHRYDKSLSTRGRGHGTVISAPILAYLVSTVHGRVLYDLGCDHAAIADPAERARRYGGPGFPFGPPEMEADERLPVQLAEAGVDPHSVDCVVCGHLHFDHAGGLRDFAHAEIHCHPAELAAARENADGAYIADDFAGDRRWRLAEGEYELCPGLRLIDTPGHTAGHRSLWVEPRSGPPVVVAGDAADLGENLDAEVAPGLCWRDREDLALASIRRLKSLAAAEGAELWPNHDLAHWHRLCRSGRSVITTNRRRPGPIP